MKVINQFFSDTLFNITFLLMDTDNMVIPNANIQLWWNGVDNSVNIDNLGSGVYRVSLNPILVNPGDDPILLNLTISASGYTNKYYELELAVDPLAVDKSQAPPVDDDDDDDSTGDDDGTGETPGGTNMIVIIGVIIGIVGAFGGVGVILILKKRAARVS